MSKKPRILWLSNSPFTPSAFGKVTERTCLGLLAHGYDVICAGMHNQFKLEYKGLTVLPRKSHNFFADVLPQYVEMYDRNLIISLMPLWGTAWMPDTFPHLAKRWIPYSPIEGTVDHSSTMIQPGRKALAVMSPSRDGQEQLLRFIDRVYLYQHGVDLDAYCPLDQSERRRLREEAGIRDGDFVLGFCGANLGDRKDIPRLIKTFGRFAEAVGHEQVHLYIHCSKEEESLRSWSIDRLGRKYGVKVKVPEHDPGLTSPDDNEMREIYNLFDVYISMSRAEGFGMPILEAEACSVPCLVTDIAAHRELVGDHGWYIKSADSTLTLLADKYAEMELCSIDDAVEKLLYLYRNRDELRSRGAEARRFASNFGWDDVIDSQLMPILEEIEPLLEAGEGVQPHKLPLIPREIEPKRVLDVGCGLTQPYRPYLERLGEYAGVDIRGDGRGVVKANAEALPFKDGEFGFVWCSEVIEHLDRPERAIAEAKRVGRHGVITFSTPRNPNFGRDPTHRVVQLDSYAIDSQGNGLIIW